MPRASNRSAPHFRLPIDTGRKEPVCQDRARASEGAADPLTATRRHRRLLAYLKARQKGYGSPPRSISRTPFFRPPVGLFCDAYAITNIFRSCRSGRSSVRAWPTS